MKPTLCPECCKAPTTRPGQPCETCDYDREERLEVAARTQAIEDHLQSLADRIAALPVQGDALTTGDGKVLGRMLCDGFDILFDLIAQTSELGMRSRLAKVLKP